MKRFDNDFLGELSTDAKPHIANLANDIRLLREQSDFLLFAKPHFTQAMLHFRSGGELLDANRSACADVAQRTHERLLAFGIRLHA